MRISDRLIPGTAGVALALIAHLAVGWMVSPLGAVLAGWLRARGTGIASGAVVLVVSWGLLVGYNFAVAPAETTEMTRVVAGILGLGPGASTVVVTLLAASILGGAGGGFGAALRRVWKR
jgi:hypothetical protein